MTLKSDEFEIGPNGYAMAEVDDAGTMRPVHDVLYRLLTGTWPRCAVEHIDGNKLNNKLENLRMRGDTLPAHLK